MYPQLRTRPRRVDSVYDRHVRLLGDVGQERLDSLKVGVIELGGGGSLVNGWLSPVGVGHSVAVDFDRIEPSNLPRVVGATRWDAAALSGSGWEWLRRARGCDWHAGSGVDSEPLLVAI
jgi:hypothetical protein